MLQVYVSLLLIVAICFLYAILTNQEADTQVHQAKEAELARQARWEAYKGSAQEAEDEAYLDYKAEQARLRESK